MPTLGVYIQVPFCASRCSFCNFSSRVERSSIFDQYTRSLQAEITGSAGFYAERAIPRETLRLPVDSVYIGGGTPTLLGAERLGLLVGTLRDRLEFNRDLEFTLETTPGSVNASQLQALRRLGVNRLSIGAQTFDDRELRTVGRLHAAADSEELVNRARDAGFANLSLDVIAGLPHQSATSFRRTLETAARLRPQHLSLYLFEIDEKSRLGREVVHGGNRYAAEAAPDEQFMVDAYESGRRFLASEGYVQYEISNFALPGYESHHNQKYWQLDPYVGFGAGAHSFDGLRRWANQIEARSYVATVARGHSPVTEFRVIPPEEQIEEFFFLGLRQLAGVDLSWARSRWGTDHVKPWEDKILSLTREGWLFREGDRVRLSPCSYLVSNEIFQEFVSV
jgi:putative oxygen-independent coproporphyrinogen III oxidase